MINVLTFFFLSVSCYLLILLIGLTNPKDVVLAGFCVAAALLNVWGYVLSSLHSIAYRQ